MSITDVDKTGPDRGAPMPNTVDKTVQRLAHGTTSINFVTPLTNETTNPKVQSGIFQVVQQNTILIVNDGSTETTEWNAHNLGYVPWVQAMLPNSTITGTAAGTITGASIVLPNFTNATISGGNINFQTWIYYFVDTQNIYFNMLNSSGSPVSQIITYYLYRQVASD